jgi:hypothetical protein
MWLKTSNLSQYQPIINENYKALAAIALELSQSIGNAGSDEYKTFTSLDSGPPEYRIIQAAMEHAQEIDVSIKAIEDGILLAEQSIPVLKDKIEEFIAVKLDGKPGDPEKLKSEFMSITRRAYNENFKGGFNVDPSTGVRWLLSLYSR